MRLFILVSMIGVACAPLLSAQQDEQQQPEPYEYDEFDEALHKIRRFEVVTIGSFPLTYLASLLVYDIYRFTAESVKVGQINPLYAPLFFAPTNKPPFTQEETIGLILTSVGISILVGLADLIINEIEANESN